MKCNGCPMYSSWSNESDSGEACGLFGDGWDSPFQYEDKYGNVVGCYIDKHLIEKREKEYERELARRVEYYLSHEERKDDGTTAD